MEIPRFIDRKYLNIRSDHQPWRQRPTFEESEVRSNCTEDEDDGTNELCSNVDEVLVGNERRCTNDAVPKSHCHQQDPNDGTEYDDYRGVKSCPAGAPGRHLSKSTSSMITVTTKIATIILPGTGVCFGASIRASYS